MFGFDVPNVDFITILGMLGVFVIYTYVFIIKVLLY